MIQAPGTISCVAATGSPLCQSHKVLPLLHQSHMVLSIHSTKLHCPLPSPPKPHGPLFSMAAMPGFKSQHQSSSAAPFPTPPIISYTCQHSLFFQLYWAAKVSPGRRGPMARSQSSPSSHSGAVTRGSCFPVSSRVEVTPIPPWLKAGPQLFNISMKAVKGYRYVKCPWGRGQLAAKLLLHKTALNGPAPCVPSPSSGLWG